MWTADKTIKKINNSIQADGGAAFRQHLRLVIPKIEDAYRGESSPFRSHLGVSMIGRECDRELWYSFRWYAQKDFSGRVQRLFNRGHIEEARFIAMLLSAGFELWYETEDGGQFRFSDIGGHYGSALDGVVRGIPELPEGSAAYVEFKTSNEKGFKKLAQEGMQKAKPEHYAQVQVCMAAMQLPYTLYLVVNKNNDDLYGEILERDVSVSEHYRRRAHNIIFSPKPLAKISKSPGWWKCRFCDYKDNCHKNKAPVKNCRTCRYSKPLENGTWSCDIGREEINTDAKYVGCPHYEMNRS